MRMILYFLLLTFTGSIGATNITYPFPSTIQNGSVILTGVNLANAGFTTNDDGSGSNDGTYPLDTDAEAWFDLGFNFIRYSFNWRFFQQNLTNPIFTNNDYYQRLLSNVTSLTKTGAVVNVDCHMYNRYDTNQIIGQNGPPASSLATMWSQIAMDLKDNPNVILGLMNEPHDEDIPDLVSTMQTVVSAIRDCGSEHYILLPCTQYSGMSSWANCGPMMSTVSDPLNKTLFDIHSYYDSNHSGESGDCLGFDSVQDDYESVTQTLRQTGRHAVLSEFGGESSIMCNNTVNDALSYLDQNSDVWLGWTAWGALLNPPGSEALGEGPTDELYLTPNTSFVYPNDNISSSSVNLARDALMPHRQPLNFSVVPNNTFGSTLSTTPTTQQSTTASPCTNMASASSTSSSSKTSDSMTLLVPRYGALNLFSILSMCVLLANFVFL